MKTDHIYKDATGAPVGTITRVDPLAGEKTFFASEGFPKPRPLYGLDLLAAAPDAAVLVVEGEKTAEAARAILPEFAVVTSPFGASSAAGADWSPLAGRNVTLWPDNDKPGKVYARALLNLVPGIKVVNPRGFPEAWDLADTLPEDITLNMVRGIISDAKAPATKPKANGKANGRANGKAHEKNAAAALKASLDAALKEQRRQAGAELDGDAVLDAVHAFLGRFVSYPSQHARVAHTLWIAHAHLIEIFDTTPRLAFMSAEKESGKTRALEVTNLLVPSPVFSISASPAVIVRLVSASRCTILYDEIDGVFGSAKAQEANLDLRSVLNGGYRRGAKVHRCVTRGTIVETEELEAFAAVAVAGLRTLPDMLASRSIFVHMRRRAPDEKVESFRERILRAQARPIFDDLTAWCAFASEDMAGNFPDMPAAITDRAADCWEPLLAVADAAGNDWPEMARAAAVHLTRRSSDESLTVGVELLAHIRDAFGGEEKLWTSIVCERLCERDESPWKDLYGKELDDRGLAKRLKPYGIKSKDVWIAGKTKKGYAAADFYDAWKRYLPSAPGKGDEGDEGEEVDNKNKNLALIADIALGEGKPTEACPACDGNLGKGCPTCKPKGYGVGGSA